MVVYFCYLTDSRTVKQLLKQTPTVQDAFKLYDGNVNNLLRINSLIDSGGFIEFDYKFMDYFCHHNMIPIRSSLETSSNIEMYTIHPISSNMKDCDGDDQKVEFRVEEIPDEIYLAHCLFEECYVCQNMDSCFEDDDIVEIYGSGSGSGSIIYI